MADATPLSTSPLWRPSRTPTAGSRCQAFTTAAASTASASCPTPKANGPTAQRSSTSRTGRPDRQLHLRRRRAGRARPGAGRQPIPLRPCRRHALLALRHHLLCLDAPAAGDCRSRRSQRSTKARFNKIRMGVFPKDYPFNTNEPLLLRASSPAPMASAISTGPIPSPSAISKRRSAALREMGIEADIIIFHPYDRWGYCDMSAEQDFRYVAYLAARLAAYRNVWWSLANEYDFLLDTKPMAQWDRYFHILQENDPYRPPAARSTMAMCDELRPHASRGSAMSASRTGTSSARRTGARPTASRWSTTSPNMRATSAQPGATSPPQELVHRFWITLMRGGYAGHGETYAASRGHHLVGQGRRTARRGLEAHRLSARSARSRTSRHGLDPDRRHGSWPWSRVSGGRDGEVRYIYFGEHQPVVSGPPACPWRTATMRST